MNYEFTYQQILDGLKTRTSRIQAPGETLENVLPDLTDWLRVKTARGRVKWETGKTYAIQVGRTAPTLRVRRNGYGDLIHLSNEDIRRMTALGFDFDNNGWMQARIEIVDIASECITDITPEQARAEGISGNYEDSKCVQAFGDLWNRIHKAKGKRFQDRPMVWVIYFKLATLETAY